MIEIGTIIFLIFIIAVSGYIYLDSKEKQEENYEQYEYTNSTDTSNMTDEEIKTELINQIRGININLVELQNQLDKQNKKIKNIKEDTGLITAILLIPIIIGIIAILISIHAGSNILKTLSNNTDNTSVYVTNQNESIIEDSEYYGQDNDNSNLNTYYETDYQNN